MNKFLTFIIITILNLSLSFAQNSDESSLSVDSQEFLKSDKRFNPLSPAKAAFYSAIVPGLGQAYNKSYWKMPIVYGALASSLYYYSINNTAYKRYRTAFKLRSAGKTDEFTNTITSIETLESAQQVLKTNRDTSLLTFVGLYVLQILEASIDAHLKQFEISDNITFDPGLMNDDFENKNYVGLSLNLNF